MKSQNYGVCCDVSCCVHNERGCDCVKDKIRVTTGDNLKNHYCGSFECRPEFEDPYKDINM